MTKRQHFIFQTSILCAVLVVITGCCYLPKGGSIQDPVPVGAGIATDITTQDVSQQINDRSDQFQTLSGLSKIGIQTWEERYRFYEVIVLHKPGRFRLETLGALDQPVIFLTTDDMILSLYSKKHNRFYTGIATQENLFRLSGLNLSVEDAILVFSGNVPRLSRISSEWGMPLNENIYYLERTSLAEECIQRIWFDTTIGAVVKIQEHMLSNGELTLDIDFQDYRGNEGEYAVPAYILIDRPFDRTRVVVEYTSLQVNHMIDQSLFTFVPPENAERHVLEDVYGEEFERLAPYEEFRVNN